MLLSLEWRNISNRRDFQLLHGSCGMIIVTSRRVDFSVELCMGKLYPRDMASSCLSLGILAVYLSSKGRHCKMRP